MTHADTLIIGAGHAGGLLAAALRQKGYEGAIVMVGDEPEAPYERPPLSKAYLVGDLDAQRLFLRKDDYWAERNIALKLGVSVRSIDCAARQATLLSGETLTYDWAVFATGGRPRPLPVPGADLVGVHYLRTKAEVEAIRHDLANARRVAVIGGGYIGLEVAASARKLGREVTVIEALDRVLARVTSEPISRFYEGYHRAQGVDVRLNSAVQAIEGSSGRVTGVRLAGGDVVPADMVVVGIGIIPNQDVAAAAGIACSNGIDVDDHCRTSDAHVLAIGDVAAHPNLHCPIPRVRLESVQNASDQAKVAASVIMGTPAPYGDLPWFWSDQYDLKLQTAGLCMDYDDIVIRGEPSNAGFAVIYLRGGQMIAVDAVNSVKDFMAAKKLIQEHARPDRTSLADPEVPLKSLIAA